MSAIEQTTEERVEVISEPLTYREHGDHSLFRDIIDAERGMFGAQDRLARHAREMEERVHPDRGSGTGGSFAPPLWLNDRFASVPRPGRVLADMIPNLPLPQGVQSINIPVLTAGMGTVTIADDSAESDTDITDTSVTAPVVTITGQDDVSQQLLDQSPRGAHLDWVLFKDLEESYNATLETQLINGSGTSGQILGLLNITNSNSPANINTITYTDATPTATEMFTFFGQAVAAVGINRLQPPEVWLMTTARQAWIASSEDQQQRPLMVAGAEGPGEFQLVQYPVKLDDAIPRNLGGGTNQDVIILCKPSDMVLLEGEPRTNVFVEVGSGNLRARIQMHRYVAAVLNRYPTGIAAIEGTGMIPPSGF
jgi:HK97 family phage major capsid protein